MSEEAVNSNTLSLQDRLLLWLLRAISRCSLPVLQTVAGWLGGFFSLFPSGTAWVVRRNLELCFPEQSPTWLTENTRKNIISTAQTALEFVKTWGMPPSYSISQIKAVENRELLDQAMAAGKGVMLIVPHYGAWEFMNAWINQIAKTVIMYKPSKNKAVDAFVLAARSREGASLVPTDEKGVKALFKALKMGGITAILPDHVPHDNGGIFSPFFGISVWTGVLASRLIQKTQCQALMMSCTRRSDGGFTIRFDLPDPAVYDSDINKAVDGMNRSTEALIRRDPTQYQWTYKRFKKCEHRTNVYQ